MVCRYSSPARKTVVGKFGKSGKALGELSTVHDIDCRNENEILVGEIVAWRAQKFILGGGRR